MFTSTIFVFLSTVLLILSFTENVTSERNLWTDDFTLASAQCSAKCLHGFLEMLTAESHTQTETSSADSAKEKLSRLERAPGNILNFCSRHQSCQSCLKACSFDPRLADCQKDCQGSVFCEQGCKNLRDIAMNRPGSCPKTQDPRLDQCSTGCETDMDCVYSVGAKCCNNGLCNLCKMPLPFIQNNVPKSPTPTLNLIDKIKQLSWVAPLGSTLKIPVIYVVQVRFMAGQTFDSRQATSWQNIKSLTETFLELEEVMVGYLYQFRLAAVSKDGSSGFGNPSLPQRVNRDPKAPSQPTNLSDGVWRIYSSGRINVNILWSPPVHKDLDVHSYKILWVRDHGFISSDGKSLLAFTSLIKTVPGNTNNCLIQDLEPGTSYKVEVRAVSKWGEQELESTPNSIYITTPKLSNEAHVLMNKSTGYIHQDAQEACDCSNPKNKHIHMMTPTYEDSLTVRMIILGVTSASDENVYQVSWTPRICIDYPGLWKTLHKPIVAQNGYFKLTDLNFSCQYALTLTPQDSSDKKTISTCFCTPTCTEVSVSPNHQPPKCKEPRVSSTPGVPRDIKDQYITTTKEGSLVYRLSWNPPIKTPGGPVYIGYQLEWGPRLDEPVNQEMYSDSRFLPRIDASRSESKILGNITSFILGNLHRETLYIVKLKSLAKIGGRMVSSEENRYHFATEGLKKFRPKTLSPISAEVGKYLKITETEAKSSRLLLSSCTALLLSLLTTCILTLS